MHTRLNHVEIYYTGMLRLIGSQRMLSNIPDKG